jgi:cobalt-zinc-cadmium efflux system outer membrane protein
VKIPILAATLVIAASAFAQDQQSMPGMQMPAEPKPQQPAQHHHTPGMKMPPASQQDQSMPGMKMDFPPPPQDQSMPGMDMRQHGDQSGKPSKGTDMQGMHMDSPMTQVPANGSITHDTMNLQEPENPSHKTGSNVLAPDLLKDVAARPPMALQEFLDLADKTNPTLAQANAFVRRSAAQAQQAGLYPNPSVAYQGEQIRGGSFGGGEQGAYFQQSVVLGGKLGLRRNIYNQQKQSDQIGVEEQTYRVHSDVTQAFYSALTSQAMVVVRRRLVGLALDAVETVYQLANVGQADSPDILQAEVEAEQAKVEFVTAQREFIQNFRILAALSGKQDLAVSSLAGSLDSPPDLDAEQQVATIVSSSPTVRRRQQEVAIGEARLRDARREPIPDIQLKAGEQYNFEHVSETHPNPAGPQSFASAGINIPLWNRNQGNVIAAQAEIDRAKQDVVRVQLSLKQMAEPLAQSYQSARFTADRYRTELIPRAQRAYQLYLIKYRNMAMAYPQVLVSQRTLFQLQIGYLAALHDEWTNAVALQNYTLSGGLDAPMSTGSTSTSINLPNSSAGSPE